MEKKFDPWSYKEAVRPLRKGSMPRRVLAQAGVDIAPVIQARGVCNAEMAHVVFEAANAVTSGEFYVNTKFGIQIGNMPHPIQGMSAQNRN